MVTRFLALVFTFVFSLSAFATEDVDIVALFKSGDVRHPDYVTEEITLKPGDYVLATWHQDHLYFEGLKWNQNVYCDIVRGINTHISSLFTSESGCANAGFRILPVGARLFLPRNPVSYFATPLAEGESIEFVETTAFAGPLIFSHRSDATAVAWNRFERYFVNSDNLVSYLTEIIQERLPSGQEIVIRDTSAVVEIAPAPVGIDPEIFAETERSAIVFERWTNGLGVGIVVLALLVIGLFLRTRSLRKEVKEHETTRVLAEKGRKDAETHLAQVREELGEQTDELLELRERNKNLLQGLAVASSNRITMPLPPDMARTDGEARDVSLQVQKWFGTPGCSGALVHAAGAPQGILLPYDESLGTWRFVKYYHHLTQDSEAAKSSRDHLNIMLIVARESDGEKKNAGYGDDDGPHTADRVH